ncbi:MAG: MoxR family ATPase [Cyanothece sp. SIO2G6]|nr:MoxR family ATPase [Cyanothece sp. SIO2G6]
MQHKKALAEINAALLEQGYISDSAIAMAIHLSKTLKKPLLIEGPAGVGKTEIAKVMAKVMATELIRLQCYEGIDAPQALYEWNYQHQLLHLKMLENEAASIEKKEAQLFGEKFLQKRPLLKAIQTEKPSVLLIDEIDRADEEFESFLLEMLSDWQITIPEIGTMKAKSIPQVILTSNRVRELSEALRRRCLYLYIDYPAFEKEVDIVTQKVPEINGHLAREISAFMQELRKMRLEKVPGVAETLDWATALAEMHFDHLEKSLVESTLGVVLKDWDDLRHTQDSLSELFEKVKVKLRVE